ncbi:SCO4848 family membrane protein [Nocardioides insulae]|uniref:SCO4848 family membrane protein n=1 Tax=Nocardioides insulae TaxID=394734 RepID=UPI00040C1916|nr:hypothetical protein [Nocardioides insulae]
MNDKKLGRLLLGVSLWNFLTWTMFARNLNRSRRSGEQRPAGYWISHTVLIVVNLFLGGLLGATGFKSVRSGRG